MTPTAYGHLLETEYITGHDYTKALELAAQAEGNFNTFVELLAAPQPAGLDVRFQNLDPVFQKQIEGIFADAAGQPPGSRAARTFPNCRPRPQPSTPHSL